MKKENDIRVSLYRVKGDAAPFVLVDYLDKNAEEHNGVMMLDSGCMGNILSHEMAGSIGPLCRIEEKGTKLYSIAHEVTEAEKVKFSFALGGIQFHEQFCITPKEMPIHIKGMQVVGILGLRFMLKYGIAIDYSDFSCHTSDVSPKTLSISDCDFFFPLEPGLNSYGLPVVAFTQGDNDIVVLRDVTWTACPSDSNVRAYSIMSLSSSIPLLMVTDVWDAIGKPCCCLVGKGSLHGSP